MNETERVIQWLRTRASLLSKMADDLESMGSSDGEIRTLQDTIGDRAVAVLELGCRRLPDLAKQLGVSAAKIRAALEDDQRVTRNNRGWYSLAELRKA